MALLPNGSVRIRGEYLERNRTTLGRGCPPPELAADPTIKPPLHCMSMTPHGRVVKCECETRQKSI